MSIETVEQFSRKELWLARHVRQVALFCLDRVPVAHYIAFRLRVTVILPQEMQRHRAAGV